MLEKMDVSSKSCKITKIGEIPSDWRVSKLGELADIRRGASPRPIRDPKWFSETPDVGWVRIADVTKSKKYLQETEQYLSPLGVEKSRLVTKGNLIMSICGTIGRPVILNIKACIHDGFVVFNDIDKKQLDKNFMLYLLVSLEDYFKGQGQPGTQVNLNTSIVEKTLVALPPIAEQQKIADILTSVDNQIENVEQLIIKTKELKKGLMYQLLTKGIGYTEFKQTEFGEIPLKWEIRELASLKKEEDKYSYSGGPFGSDLTSKEYTDTGVQIIQLQNIGEGYFNDHYKIFTSDEKADKLKKCNIYPGDLVIAKMADPVARACIVPDKNPRYLMASDAIRLSTNSDIVDNKFLMYAINSPYFRKQAELNSTGTTRLRIGLTILSKLKLICPPLSDQRKIADILSSMDEQIESYEQEKAKYVELKKGLMQQLLTGKIRVTV